jgi:GT2 family glycosyltransferase
MALIAMATWNTVTNDRKWQMEATLESLYQTVDRNKHRVIVVDNGSDPETGTLDILAKYTDYAWNMKFISAGSNLGTARAINLAWKERAEFEHCLKMDSDVTFDDKEWLDRLEDCINRDPTIGICGLKRIDCIESPYRNDWYKTELKLLPSNTPDRWLVVEVANHVMGTCQLYNYKLLDKIGYLYQMGGLYGFDDSLAAARCKVAGFYSCFYPAVKINHIDPGTTPYQKWKEAYASTRFEVYHKFVEEYSTGKKSIYHGPEDE